MKKSLTHLIAICAFIVNINQLIAQDYNTVLREKDLNGPITGTFNTAVGVSTLNSTSGGWNSAFGHNALSRNSSGYVNSAFGASALINNTTGAFNTAMGCGALLINSTGIENVALGYYAGFYNKTGSGNVFIGPYSDNYIPDSTNSNRLFIHSGRINNIPLIYGEFDNLKVGIGTINPQSTLAVNGKITAKGLKLTATGWADFVFDKQYKLLPLNEVENYIKTCKHLPNVPTTEEVEKDGMEVGDMNVLLLQKIEELTLYMIEQQKQIQKQEKEIELLKSNQKKNRL